MIPTHDDIRAAYRLLLDREPDPDGYLHYLRRAAAGELTVAGLRETILISEEYRSRQRSRRARVDLDGVTVVVDAEDPLFGALIAAHGAWEDHIAAVALRHLPKGGTFVDVGANVGTMAFRAARHVGPRGRVIAFEPDPANVQCFLAGLTANDFGHVALLPIALSDAPSVFALQGGSNAYLAPAGTTEIMATAQCGDPFLLHEARIDMIKLDIEGHEPQALRGMVATLALHRPWLLVEFNPRCLRDHIGEEPAAFAAELFRLAPRLTAIRHDGAEFVVDQPSGLIDLWEDTDRASTASGLLPAGMAHLDLLLKVE